MLCPQACLKAECKMLQSRIEDNDVTYDTGKTFRHSEVIYYCDNFPDKVSPDKCSEVDHVITNKQLTDLEQNILNAMSNLHDKKDNPFAMTDLKLALDEIKILKTGE